MPLPKESGKEDVDDNGERKKRKVTSRKRDSSSTKKGEKRGRYTRTPRNRFLPKRTRMQWQVQICCGEST